MIFSVLPDVKEWSKKLTGMLLSQQDRRNRGNGFKPSAGKWRGVKKKVTDDSWIPTATAFANGRNTEYISLLTLLPLPDCLQMCLISFPFGFAARKWSYNTYVY